MAPRALGSCTFKFHKQDVRWCFSDIFSYVRLRIGPHDVANLKFSHRTFPVGKVIVRLKGLRAYRTNGGCLCSLVLAPGSSL
ncbi:MAG: hypothetical protein ACI915_003681 [Gammaproteobacteria bacterium]|jgi:hypothetical protein